MKPIALYYLSLLDDIRAAARGMGYAVGLHGSLQRDLDLIAVPWRADCKTAEELVQAVTFAVGGFVHMEGVENKPHGRKAWIIRLTDAAAQREHKIPLGTAIIDLSVMPLISSDQPGS